MSEHRLELIRLLVSTYFSECEIQELYHRFDLGPDEQAALWEILGLWRPEGHDLADLATLAENQIAGLPQKEKAALAARVLAAELAERSRRRHKQEI